MKSSDSVKTYLNEIRSVPLLTKEEEIELARRVEECQLAIIINLLETGVLIREIEMLKKGIPESGEEDDVSNIITEIIDLYQDGHDRDLLISRIIDLNRITGVIGKTMEDLRREADGGQNKLADILNGIEEIEHKLTETKNSIIKANLRLVADIARKYSRSESQLMDLIQEGNIGLMLAVDKFDYKKGFRFSTYAIWWIRQYILKSAVLSATSFNIPAHTLSMINRMIRASVGFMQESGREPTPEELSEKMGLPVEKIKGFMDVMIHKEVSLEAPAGEDGESSLSEFVEDKGQASPADDIIGGELMTELNEVLSALSPKEEKVIRMKFGIGETRRFGMEEIARELNISRERVRQIEAKALRKLRHPKAYKSLKIFLEK